MFHTLVRSIAISSNSRSIFACSNCAHRIAITHATRRHSVTHLEFNTLLLELVGSASARALALCVVVARRRARLARRQAAMRAHQSVAVIICNAHSDTTRATHTRTSRLHARLALGDRAREGDSARRGECDASASLTSSRARGDTLSGARTRDNGDSANAADRGDTSYHKR